MQSCGVSLMAANAAGWHKQHGECRCQQTGKQQKTLV
jgi:hypothetical protein